jgi:hypothetical protein
MEGRGSKVGFHILCAVYKVVIVWCERMKHRVCKFAVFDVWKSWKVGESKKGEAFFHIHLVGLQFDKYLPLQVEVG